LRAGTGRVVTVRFVAVRIVDQAHSVFGDAPCERVARGDFAVIVRNGTGRRDELASFYGVARRWGRTHACAGTRDVGVVAHRAGVRGCGVAVVVGAGVVIVAGDRDVDEGV